jgi:asparagine synthase (glutamine-hydrolysing)
MCGIAGIFNFSGPASEDRIKAMTNCLAHRGPDSDGFFLDEGLALGHRRLSIIDLSTAANQPFADPTGRYVMVFNGEIYNYKQVKALIADYPFWTTSDTEVLLAGYIRWGPACLDHLRGMFAVAIFDRQAQELFVARDRLGVKPLYFYHDENVFLFASEIRSLLATGIPGKKLNEAAILDYFHYQSVPYPHTLIQNIMQLEAGSWMKITRQSTEKVKYWNVASSALSGSASSTSAILSGGTDLSRIKASVRELLLQSVERRLVSDVPVGAFLSGGIDSSVVVGLMAEAGQGRPNTFNIAFEEEQYDESSYAEMVARKFGANHTRILLKPDDFLAGLPDALDAMDSPSGDGVNTYIVSKAIRSSGIKVALSGVGGDELFAGYPFFGQYLKLRKNDWLWKIPAGLRRAAAGIIAPGADGKKGRMMQLLKMKDASIENAYPIFRQIVSPSLTHKLLRPTGPWPDLTSVERELLDNKKDIDRLPLLSQVSVAEYLGYTQHTLLKDTDQMSMAVSLEVREPFFDQDLVEYVLGIPDKYKEPTYPKSLMVEALKPLLPDEIVHRKKQGFLFPWNSWLKNELRSFSETRLQNMSQRPFVNGDALMAYWRRFLQEDNSVRWSELWLFIVLECWLERNV